MLNQLHLHISIFIQVHVVVPALTYPINEYHSSVEKTSLSCSGIIDVHGEYFNYKINRLHELCQYSKFVIISLSESPTGTFIIYGRGEDFGSRTLPKISAPPTEVAKNKCPP